MAARVDTSTSRGEFRRIVDDVAGAAADLCSATEEIQAMSPGLGQTQGRLDSFLEK